MPELTLEQAEEQRQEALRALREAERELGWALAVEKLEKERKLGFLLDDNIAFEELASDYCRRTGWTEPS